MIEIIPDSSQPAVRRLSDFTIEDNDYSYIMAISRYGTPYVMTKVKRGSGVSYVFLKIDGRKFTCDKKNPRLSMEEALERGYKVYATHNQMEFMKAIHKTLGKRIRMKEEEKERGLEEEKSNTDVE